MKKICIGILIAILICESALLFAGYGKDGTLYWNYNSAIMETNNPYFKTEIIYKDSSGSRIIKNTVTGEYFFVVAGAYGVTMCPIKVPEGTTAEEEIILNEIAARCGEQIDGMQGGGGEP